MVWYHGSPEMQKIERFENRTITARYITDPDKWSKLQSKLSHASNSEFTVISDQMNELTKYKTLRSPVFFSNKRSVATSYADDRRAYDYQQAEPGVISVTIDDGRTLTIEAHGESFRGINVNSVIRGLTAVGIDPSDIDDVMKMYQLDIRGNSNKISTDSLIKIVDSFEFDIIDVRGIKDNYNGGGPPSTIRMVMDPSLIHRL